MINIEFKTQMIRSGIILKMNGEPSAQYHTRELFISQKVKEENLRTHVNVIATQIADFACTCVKKNLIFIGL